MKKRKVNWLRVAAILIGGGLFIYVLLILGRSPAGWVIPSASAQDVPPFRATLPRAVTLQDRETYSMALGEKHQVCWADNNPAGVIDSIKIWRYRVEGGPVQLYLELYRAGWERNPGYPNNFCKTDIAVPKAGHWVYEAALCDDVVCSTTITSACGVGQGVGCAGAVGGTNRGWWVYAFIPAVTGPVVD
jgi:hypothetical protein